ncbi:MipA/OmpV family protein [Tepidicaulis sp. LMO-SS28]|uniref:MipA/OmpV family protein n=1 Tax=Tepidicaulis sp. LMO-SS28 TaxID=3447455 RepID=UPI003EE16F81
MESTPSVSEAGPRRQYIGAGVAFTPEYPGSGSYEANPLPDVDLRFGERIFVNTRHGAGLYLVENEHFALGTALHLRPGRDQDDAARLNGLGDIDPAAQLRAFGRLSLGRFVFGVAAAQDLGGSDGITVDISAAMPHRVNDRLTITPLISTRYGDDEYMSTWFGISPTQSARSGLQRFETSSGFTSATALVSASYRWTEHWSTRTFFGISSLLGDAADSPVVEEEIQFIGGLSVGYAF